MGSPYAGNPASFPTDFTIPDDSDPPTASANAVPFEALGDRTAYLEVRAAALGAVHTFATPGTNTWTSGPYDKRIRYEMCGGGGSGAGGGIGGTSNLQSGCGGGAGAAAPLVVGEIDILPNTPYTVQVGAGKTGGAGSTALNTAADGQQGGGSFIAAPPGTSLDALATAPGGSPGLAYDHADQIHDYDNDPTFAIAPGGSSVGQGSTTHDGFRYRGKFGIASVGNVITGLGVLTTFATAPGDGGDGVTGAMGLLSGTRNGRAGVNGMLGGSGGSKGTDDTTVKGGGGGGGGGAGPFGSLANTTPIASATNITGGNGGVGGNGSSSGAGGVGAAGGDAPANSGGGGGGGGAGGSSPSAPGHGGPGGNSAAGFVRITVVGVA